METSKYSKFLREHGIRPSVQRLAVYDYLWNNRNHPTAEDIHKALSPMITTLSRTTVYNTLRLFSEKGAAKMITIEENEMRFDADISVHGHFKCMNCGKIIDFPIGAEAVMNSLPAGCKIESTHFYAHGTCADCLKNNN